MLVRYFAVCATKLAGVKKEDIKFNTTVPFACMMYALQRVFIAHRVRLLEGWLLEASKSLHSLVALLMCLPPPPQGPTAATETPAGPSALTLAGGSTSAAGSGAANGIGTADSQLVLLLEEVTSKERVARVDAKLDTMLDGARDMVLAHVRTAVENLPWNPCGVVATPKRKRRGAVSLWPAASIPAPLGPQRRLLSATEEDSLR
jgi:hypothetical protein